MCLPDAAGHEPPVKSKAKVEFRWLEVRSVRGLTDDMGIQTTCRPELMYPHVKPVLTNPDVAGTTMTEHDFSTSGLGVLYIVELRLTDKAREKLVKEAGDRPSVELAVFVEGSYSGAWYFRKAEAAEFTPSAGFIPKAEAERIVEACK
ncbi:MAG TPA: hypothetical protein PKD86_11110 [Gemmatales bacterium]|nr:hypothetical protein [Gemmatales bacterium]HMP59894.1 hypothetical protein [Gemmatales bacterium]